MPEYTVIDKRGQEPTKEVCRVCGAPIEVKGTHSLQYNKPTMDCIKYLRNQSKPTYRLS